MELSFQSLSKGNLEEAIKVLYEIFPDDASKAELAYRASLDPKSAYWETRKILDYYVVVDKETNKIVAITGFYNLKEHTEEEIWLGWYGVVSEARGQGIGRKVLEWTITEAKKRGYKKFRLWTTTSPEEVTAQKLYDSLGLNVYSEKKDTGEEYTVLYRELNL